MTDLGELGLESTARKAILKEKHLHSIEVAAKITVQRRVMDSQKLFGSKRRPP